mgnify:CR=1 FL=1
MKPIRELPGRFLPHQGAAELPQPEQHPGSVAHLVEVPSTVTAAVRVGPGVGVDLRSTPTEGQFENWPGDPWGSSASGTGALPWFVPEDATQVPVPAEVPRGC